MKSVNDVFTRIRAELKLHTDVALAAKLEITPPTVSKIRSGKINAGATLVMRIHEVTGWTIRDIKAAFGMPCLPRWNR